MSSDPRDDGEEADATSDREEEEEEAAVPQVSSSTSSNSESTASRLGRLGLENRRLERRRLSSNLEAVDCLAVAADATDDDEDEDDPDDAANAPSVAQEDVECDAAGSGGAVVVSEEEEDVEEEPSNFQPWYLRSAKPKHRPSASAAAASHCSREVADESSRRLRRNFSTKVNVARSPETSSAHNGDKKVLLKISGKSKDAGAQASNCDNEEADPGEAMNEYWSKFQAAMAADHDDSDMGDDFRRVLHELNQQHDFEAKENEEDVHQVANDRQQHHHHHPPDNSASFSTTIRNAGARRNVASAAASTCVVNPAVGMYNWQSTKMTVKERLAFMFNNELLADVHFIVGKESQQQRIPAHRFVLSVGSAVFDAMFNSDLANRDDEITLPDVESASFLGMLRFLYSDEVQIGPETVMTTLYTAKKYAVPALEKHCVDFLKRNLGADNAFMLLTQARLFDEPQLAALCLETIDKYTPEALNAEGFIDIDIDTLSAVLDRDSLRIKEAKLFSAVLRWSEAESLRQGLPVTPENKRSVLGHVLTKIRFPLMTVEEFAQGPAQSAILSDRECVSLFLHFTVNPKPPVAFLDVPRCSMTGKEQTVCRFQQIESRWGYSGTSDKIRFIVDRRIFVVGFGLYGSIHGPSEYQVTIQIFHTGSGRLLGSNDVSFLSDGSNSTFRVMFKEPIEILPNTNYTSSATLKGLDSHYGTGGVGKVWVDCPTGGKVTFQFSYAAGNNNGTSVEDGQIPGIIFYT